MNFPMVASRRSVVSEDFIFARLFLFCPNVCGSVFSQKNDERKGARLARSPKEAVKEEACDDDAGEKKLCFELGAETVSDISWLTRR